MIQRCFLIALLVQATCLFATTATANAQMPTYCPTRSSIFGTVTSVSLDRLTLKTNESAMGSIHVYDRGAEIFTNGLALAPGRYAGIYGCLTPNRSEFRADDITLATSANTYRGYRRNLTMVEGRVDAVRPGRVLLDSNRGHGDLWVYTSRGGLRTGELVRALGTFDPMNAGFVARSLTIVAP